MKEKVSVNASVLKSGDNLVFEKRNNIYSFPDYDPMYQLKAIGTITSNLLALLEKRYKDIEETDYAKLDRQEPLGDFYASDLQDYFF